MPPPKLIGKVPVDTSSNNTKPENEDSKHDIWSQDFCVQFGNIICCPAFTDRPEYLRYLLELVLFLPLGDGKGFKKPSKKSMSSHRNRDIIDELKLESEHPVDEKALNKVLDKQLGLDQPPHTKFLDELRTVMKAKKQTAKKQTLLGLIKKDMMDIIAAWDKYAEGGVGLKSMKEYREEWEEKIKGRTSTADPAKKYTSQAVEELKKEWVLSQRRAAIRRRRIAKGKRKQKGTLNEDEDVNKTHGSEIPGNESPVPQRNRSEISGTPSVGDHGMTGSRRQEKEPSPIL